MTKIGYARVSTKDQVVDLQIDALTKAGCTVIYTDHGESGAKDSRPEWDKCKAALKAGDVLVVYSLSRAGRSVQNLAELATTLKNRGVGFESLTEHIDTGSACGSLVFHMLSALAEFERQLTMERSAAGREAARARGVKFGTKKTVVTVITAEQMRQRHEQGYPADQIAKEFGVSRATAYRVLASRVV